MSRSRDTADQINRLNSSAADATAITIDSSENVLVGTTSSFGSSGITLGSNVIYAAASSQNVANFQRYTTDGEIVRLGKDGTAVGSIGTAGDTPYISAPSAGGVRFTYLNSTNASMMPCNTTGANADATHDIGYPSVRFKDLYLSGGVYLGGTGAANKLDDVETGTFTPTYSFMTAGNSSAGYSAQQGFYTKIGNLVHFQLDLRLSAMTKGTASGDPIVNGLPFTAKNTSGYANSAPVVKLYNHSFSNIPIAGVIYNSTFIALSTMSSNVVSSSLADARGGSIIWISGSYIAA